MVSLPVEAAFVAEVLACGESEYRVVVHPAIGVCLSTSNKLFRKERQEMFVQSFFRLDALGLSVCQEECLSLEARHFGLRLNVTSLSPSEVFEGGDEGYLYPSESSPQLSFVHVIYLSVHVTSLQWRWYSSATVY